jgi:hypothetical protein
MVKRWLSTGPTGLCRIRRISTRRSTRQDAQINYLSTLTIFMKQTTYLATLPNPNLPRWISAPFATFRIRNLFAASVFVDQCLAVHQGRHSALDAPI